MRVTDVVAVGEDQIRREQRDHQHGAPPIDERQLHHAGRREQRAGDAELLCEIELVHREVVAQQRRRHVQHHRVSPVGLGDVEPESLQRVGQAVRRVGQQPQRAHVPPVLERANRGANGRRHDDARREHRAPAAAGGEQEKERVAGQQQDHREVIAEAERVRRKERVEPPVGLDVGPPQQQQQRQRHERDMEGIDLGDDRLAPERIGRGEQHGGGRGGGDRARQLGADQDDEPAGDRGFDRRRQVERVRRVAAGQPERRPTEGEIQRVAVAGRDQRRSHHRLKRAGVAEVESRKQGRAVQREGRQRDGQRDEPCAAGHGEVRQWDARLAAISDRTSARERALRTWRGCTQPRRAVKMPRSIWRPSISER